MEESIHEFLQRLVREGYIAENGAPLKCHFCESKNFDEKCYYEEHTAVEKVVNCKACGKQVGNWSYGAWQI